MDIDEIERMTEGQLLDVKIGIAMIVYDHTDDVSWPGQVVIHACVDSTQVRKFIEDIYTNAAHANLMVSED